MLLTIQSHQCKIILLPVIRKIIFHCDLKGYFNTVTFFHSIHNVNNAQIQNPQEYTFDNISILKNIEDKTSISSPINSGHLDAVAAAEFMESECNFRLAEFQCMTNVYLLLEL